MLLTTSLLLLLSIAISVRRDKSILYSRLTLTILTCCFLLCVNSFYLKFYDLGMGIFAGLLQSSAISHVFQLFAFIVTVIILQLNCFYPRKVWTEDFSSLSKLVFYKLNYYNTFILNKMAAQYRILEYPLIILFVVMGGVLLMSSSDLFTIFLAIELQSYGLYILCSVTRDSEPATGASITYFLLGGLSSCFILLACALLYGNSGNTTFDGLYVINSISSANAENTLVEASSGTYEPYYINFSLIIMSTGLLFKIGAAPFHFWSPDVYDGLPTIVTTFVSTFAKISILILLLELVHYTSNYLTPISAKETITQTNALFIDFSWTFSLLVSSFLSLIIGAVLGLTQFRIKKLYAYSTISHIGFILLALSVNSIESIQSFIFYLMQYTITNVNAFLLLIAIGYSLYLYGEKKENSDLSEQSTQLNEMDSATDMLGMIHSPVQFIKQVKGYFYINPYLALSLAITLFSFVGIPPLVGFFAKQMVLSSALDKGYVFMVFIGILTSVVSAYYYLAIVKEMFFNKPNYILYSVFGNTSFNVTILSRSITKKNKKHSEALIKAHNIQLSGSISITISILTMIIVLFILIPQEWLNTAIILALILFNC